MGALDGYKILDFTTLLPGPYATMTLADMGAEVLKVSGREIFSVLFHSGGLQHLVEFLQPAITYQVRFADGPDNIQNSFEQFLLYLQN